jgi:hypothetical protein
LTQRGLSDPLGGTSQEIRFHISFFANPAPAVGRPAPENATPLHSRPRRLGRAAVPAYPVRFFRPVAAGRTSGNRRMCRPYPIRSSALVSASSDSS